MTINLVIGGLLIKQQNRTRLVESFMTTMGLLGAVATLPTIIKIWVTESQHSGGQSLITWSFYALMAACWLVYGLHYDRKAIWITNGIYLVLYVVIVLGIVHHSGMTY